MSGNTVSIIIIIVCLIMSAYFSATETAFSTMNQIRLKNMAEKGNKRAALALKIVNNFDTMLSTILIGNNLVNILLSSVATVVFLRLLGEQTGTSVSTAFCTVIVLIFGEISPKSIAKESPESFALFSAPILRVFMVVLKPFNILFSLWKKLLSKIFVSQEDHGITDEELLTIVEEAEQEGGIDEEEGTLIRSAIEFMDLETIDIYTPRVDIIGVPDDVTIEELENVFMETGYSRLPVYKDDIDHIVGIINQKDFHNNIKKNSRPMKDYIRPVLFITPSMKIGSLLKDLQESKTHMAIIIDEFGGTAGLVTIEDIVEELVGDIWDEHDRVVQEIQKISDDEYEVSGGVSLDKVFEKLDIQESLDFNTISGWIMNVLEGIPREGETFVQNGLEVTVLKMQGHRIQTVKVHKLPEPQKEEA